MMPFLPTEFFSFGVEMVCYFCTAASALLGFLLMMRG